MRDRERAGMNDERPILRSEFKEEGETDLLRRHGLPDIRRRFGSAVKTALGCFLILFLLPLDRLGVNLGKPKRVVN